MNVFKPFEELSDVPVQLVVGPMKAGTTWIHEYLMTRGDVCLPGGTKETFFYDRNFHRGRHWYRAHFRHANTKYHRTLIEVAPSYFPNEFARRRIKETVSPRTILVCVREPVARAWSHFLHMKRYGYVRGGLDAALSSFPDIVNASRYSVGVQEWKLAFPGAEVALLPFETLKSDPNTFARMLCLALRVPFKEVPSNLFTARNEGGVAPSGFVASAARRASGVLRGARLYKLIDTAKALGAHRLAYGRSGSPNAGISFEDRQLLDAALEEERVWYADFMHSDRRFTS